MKGRADVVIPLPDRHAIVIDSKCSLTAYTDLINAELNSDASAYADALGRHITSTLTVHPLSLCLCRWIRL